MNIIRMAREAGFVDGAVDIIGFDGFANFAALVAAAERERMEIDSIHTCHDECHRPACVAVREAVKAEREACAQLCLETEPFYGVMFAAAIRARGEK
jgi:hypothetical protein